MPMEREGVCCQEQPEAENKIEGRILERLPFEWNFPEEFFRQMELHHSSSLEMGRIQLYHLIDPCRGLDNNKNGGRTCCGVGRFSRRRL